MDNVRLMDEMRKRMGDPAGQQAIASPPAESPTRSERVEAAMRAIEESEGERESLKRELDEERTNRRGIQAEVDALMLANSRLITEIEACRNERLDALRRLAGFEAVFEAALTVLQKHRPVTLSGDGANLSDAD
ncbi:MAG: hypothetical protein EHM67_06470 [Hyphomicrobiaceae bacterium]|jgi:hypothetical protein|nr:MAG: hypothetical protein EHM67_06470 [Hyphomicrobiaceae bacterium]